MADKQYKPEEVGYGLIGEDHKLPNEVGYNINGEITKDASAVENANNQTTTGMAGQIPGINSPKLFASTSIIGLGGGAAKIGEVHGTGNFPANKMNDFQNWNIISGTADISLNPSYPARIYLREGAYLIFVYINAHDPDTFIYTMFCKNTRLLLGTTPANYGGYLNFMTMAQVADGEYIDLSINPDGNINSAEATVKVIKLT